MHEQILEHGGLCFCKEDKTLYVGIRKGDSYESIPYDSVHLDTKIKSIKSTEIQVVFNVSQRNEDICAKVLKPFSKSHIPIPASLDWIKCVEKFIPIEKLFMFILTSKSKDYYLFMDLFVKNLHRIAWDTSDGDGNTMIHYTTIMDSYPKVACDIIRYVAESDQYRHLICQENNKGVVPLAFILLSKLSTESKVFKDKTFPATPEILNQLISSKASVLKLENGDRYSWKGGNEILFGQLISDQKDVLLITNSFKGKEKSSYRICCRLCEPQICQLLSDKVIRMFNPKPNTIPEKILEQILKFPCDKIFQSLFPKYVRYHSPIPSHSTLLHFALHSLYLSLPNLEQIINSFKSEVDWLVKDGNKNTILHSVISGNQDEKINFIIETCPEVQFKKMWKMKNQPTEQTPFDLMIETNSFDPLAVVLNRFPDFLTFHKDSEGNTLFHTAAEKKIQGLFNLLINNPLATKMVNAINSEKKSPLMICVEERLIDEMDVLIHKLGCEMTISTNHGCNILHIAVIHYESKIFSEILDCIRIGINPTLINETIFSPHHSTSTAKSLESYIGLTPLLLCMTLKHLDAARLLIAAGAEIDKSESNRPNFIYLLMQVCHNRDELEDFFKLQLKTYNYKTPPTQFCPDFFKDETLLYLSIDLNNTEAFELLLPRSTVNMLAYQESVALNNALHLALSLETEYPFIKEILKRVKCLKEEGLETDELINQHNRKGKTSLLLSVEKGDVAIVDRLLTLNCDVTAKYGQEATNILHQAIVQGNPQIIKSILLKIEEKGVSKELIEFRNKENLTPLQLAIRNKDSKILEILLGSDINLENQNLVNDVTLLDYASEQGNSMYELICKKLESKPNAPLSCEYGQQEQTPGCELSIELATKRAEHRNPEIESSENEDTRTEHLIEIVSCNTNEKIQEYLENTQNPIDSTELSLIASQHGTPEVITYLFDKSYFDVTSKTKEQNTVIHCGVSNPCSEVLKRILHFSRKKSSTVNPNEKNANKASSLQHVLDARNGKGRSALESAIELCKKDAFDNLMQSDASFNTRDDEENSILHSYMQCSDADPYFLDQILKNIPPDFVNSPNTNGHTPLHLAVMSENEASFEKIINCETCEYDTLTSEGDNIIHLAAKNGNNGFLHHVLEDVKVRDKDKPEKAKLLNLNNKENKSPVFYAVEKGSIEAFLNEPDVDVEGTGQNEKSLMHEVVLAGDNPGTIEKLLLRCKHLLNRKDSSKRTPLCYAVMNERTNTLQSLLECPSIDVSSQDVRGMTVLHHSVKKEDSIFNSLFDEIAQRDHGRVVLNIQDSDLKTVLHHAIELQPCNLTRVKKILSGNPDLSLRDKEGRTPLLLSISLRNPEVVNLLLNLGCDISPKLGSANILHVALSNDNREVIKSILEHISEKELFYELVSHKNENGHSPLRIALRKNSPEILRQILMVEKRVNPKTEQ